jgi:hypothetical protein
VKHHDGESVAFVWEVWRDGDGLKVRGHCDAVPYKVTVDGKVECVAGKLETIQAATYRNVSERISYIIIISYLVL